MTQYAFYFDASKCTGCKTCQVTCKENHHLPAANLLRRVYHYGGGTWEKMDNGLYRPQGHYSYFVAMACNHCMNPACVEACPSGAMQKDAETGIVWTDHDVCIGCGSCAAACPYDAPQLHDTEDYAVKCDMCMEEISLGRTPLCVAACLMRAMDWGERDDLVAKYGEGTMEIEPLPENTTGATTIMTPHPAAPATGKGDGMLLNLEEEI